MVQKEELKRPRGRPRSFDPDAALDQARAVFWNLGYAATSLDDIAKATGLNRPSLYGAFGDKHALYMAALQRTADQSVAAITRGLAAEGPLRQVLAAFYAAAIAVYRAGDAGPRGCFVVGTAVTQAVDDAEVRALLSRYLADCDALFAARFETARTAGDFPAGLDPAAAAPIAAAAMHTLAIRARAGDSPEALEAVGEAAVAMICGPT
ncbi:TetR/AcrR family transcriptional regulator [Phenylobacterium sp.]|uniref:TetR/AcrR family transcriptional regulator n=1 Tax=Phenylobacterium sp. TaxID=1871053 RepID=UPI002CFDD436|nr:TetR/AcrR family transcriptional regulator [Phenylobacterium sp.]HVI31718.1 TetR/AcrR family transcriptional regulator [Phenylobacterium sp.]